MFDYLYEIEKSYVKRRLKLRVKVRQWREISISLNWLGVYFQYGMISIFDVIGFHVEFKQSVSVSVSGFRW